MMNENTTANLRQLLEEMNERSASDLHITVGQPPRFRVDGNLTDSRIANRLTPQDTQALAYSVLTETQKKTFEQENELDLSFAVENLARFRANRTVAVPGPDTCICARLRC